jgi:hypothetical protein
MKVGIVMSTPGPRNSTLRLLQFGVVRRKTTIEVVVVHGPVVDEDGNAPNDYIVRV